MHLDDLGKNWERLARGDAFHAILYRPERHDAKWDADAFFAAGIEEVDALMASIEALGLKPPRGRALDFGCAAGRLAQALTRHFREVAGVDISATMLEHANQFNRAGDACRYYHNTIPNLRIFEDGRFDLVYSNITLQHNEPRYSAGYIREFIRVLSPRGVLVFQLPSRNVDSLRHRIRIQAPYRVKKWYRALKGWLTSKADETIEMPMYSIRRERVERIVDHAGGVVVDVQPSAMAGDEWESFSYFVTRRHSTNE